MKAENSSSKYLKEIHGKESERNVVLVVEDETVSQTILKRAVPLFLPGYEVEFAQDGAEAVKMVSNELRGKVAVIITDIDMQPMNGLEMAKNLKMGEKGSDLVKDMEHVPILVNSSIEDDDVRRDDLEEMLEAGIVDSFIKKPLGAENINHGILSAICSMRAKIFQEAQAA